MAKELDMNWDTENDSYNETVNLKKKFLIKFPGFNWLNFSTNSSLAIKIFSILMLPGKFNYLLYTPSSVYYSEIEYDTEKKKEKKDGHLTLVTQSDTDILYTPTSEAATCKQSGRK